MYGLCFRFRALQSTGSKNSILGLKVCECGPRSWNVAKLPGLLDLPCYTSKIKVRTNLKFCSMTK